MCCCILLWCFIVPLQALFWRWFVVLYLFETREKHMSELFIIEEDSQSKVCCPSLCFCINVCQFTTYIHCVDAQMLSCFLLVINHVCSSPVQPTSAKEQGGARPRSSSSASFYLGLLHSTKLDVSSAMSHTSPQSSHLGSQGSSHWGPESSKNFISAMAPSRPPHPMHSPCLEASPLATLPPQLVIT